MVKKKSKNKGFTLIELLSTIVIFTLVMSVVIFVAINIVDKSKEKSYKVTVNNVQNVTSSYLLENGDRLFYVGKEGNDNLEYQCVTVRDLVENGYFKDDVYESFVKKDTHVKGDDYVYIERDKNTKTVSKIKYLIDGDVEGCSEAVKALSDISIVVSPDGWSREKNINIRYKIKNYFNINDYTYNYKYNKDNVLSVISDDGDEKKLMVTDNGSISAWIEENNVQLGEGVNEVIDKIDRVGPRIELGKYTGNNYVGDSVVIPLNVIDYGIGLDITSFTLDDLVVTIGDKVITEGIKLSKVSNSDKDDNVFDGYNLEIKNSVDTGLIKIRIEDNKLFDKLENPNNKVEIDTGIVFNIIYNINYNLQFKNAVNGSKSPSKGIYGENVYIDNPNYENYSFKGWTFNGNTSTAKYGSSIDSVNNSWSNNAIKVVDKYFKDLSSVNDEQVTMTANWEVNLVERIKYLYNTNASGNKLRKDNNGNIRFYGDSPNNYVKFNDELWRIIGVFNVSDGNTTSERVKLVRVDSLFNASYDVSDSSNINGGCGVNNWSTSSLKGALNDYYAGDNADCTFHRSYAHEPHWTCPTVGVEHRCVDNFNKMNVTARNMIDNAMWYLGSIEMGGDADGDNLIGAEEAYVDEHSNRTGRQCNHNVSINCTDRESRDHTWIGMVGLISPSDYGFASDSSSCYNDDITYNYSCGTNNWLAYGGEYWTLNPRDSNWFANAVWRVIGKKNKNDSSVLGDPVAAGSYDVRPSVYLKNNVSTTLGIGTKDEPYILNIS